MSTYIFDNLQKIEKIDQSGMFNLLYNLPEQCQESIKIGQTAIEKLSASTVPNKTVRNIVYSGMGGSAIAGDLLRNYLNDELPVSLMVNRNYTIPKFVDSATLFIASSYSGNTEETLAAYDAAKKKQAQIICITSGGMLAEQAERDGYPTILIPPGLPPRTAIGYSFFPGPFYLHRLGLISDKTNDAQEVVTLLLRLRDQYATKVALEQNLAKQIASRLYRKLAVIYGAADRLDSIVTRWRTQINENSKSLANTQVIPELNHNEIVGWEVMKELLSKMHVIFICDKEVHPQIQKRIQITHELILDLADGVTEIWTTGCCWLARLWSVLFLGDFVSYYLSILNEVDPTPVKKISYLKEKLARG